jgi:hypothetical protein
MPEIDDLLGIAALAMLGWTAALAAQPVPTAAVTGIASDTSTVLAAAERRVCVATPRLERRT